MKVVDGWPDPGLTNHAHDSFVLWQHWTIYYRSLTSVAMSASSSSSSSSSSSLPVCPYGWQCYRTHSSHRTAYSHAPTPDPLPLEPFPTPFQVAESYEEVAGCTKPRSLVELTMLQLMGGIREKPNWFEKVFDVALVEKWTDEIRAKHPIFQSKRNFAYLWAELQHDAKTRNGPITRTGVEGVFRADGLIEPELRQSLLDGLKPLENVPDEKKDWHPGTNKQVLDLVHPSMWCYVIGQTNVTDEPFNLSKALAMFGAGAPKGTFVSPSTEEDSKKKKNHTNYFDSHHNEEDPFVSKRFQWLPAEFSVSSTGEVSIDSYINNLHPVDHAGLYTTIGAVFQRFVPMFERVLSHLDEPQPHRIQPDAYTWHRKPKWYDQDVAPTKKSDGGQQQEERKESDKKNDAGDDDDADEFESEEEPDEDDEDWWENRPTYQPVVKSPFKPFASSTISLRGRKLQVIVKLAEIILRPEQPSYDGGSWHVEGMKNENIVASGIYYIESTNITESVLSFRQACTEPDYEQNDNTGVEAIYGLADALNQPIGGVVTQTDRCIAFPNMYQHQVQPFKLEDPTKIGIRKILVFFLVDPSVRVISTATVPPQQVHWLRNAPTPYHKVMLDSTPLIDPLIHLIFEFVQLGTVTQEQAEKQREELMSERKFYSQKNTESLFEREFSLCEH